MPTDTLPVSPSESAQLDTPVDEMLARFRRGAAQVRGGQASAALAGAESIAAAVRAWLPPVDAEVFHAIGAAREQALRASRGGDAAAAEAGMTEAGRLLAGARLSPGGRLLAESLDASARAYLHYRAGRRDAALDALDAALASTNALHDEHAFAGAKARRLHLAHLAVRVHAIHGDAWRAVELACRIWDYVEGNAAAWPFVPYARAGAGISPRMAALSLNEVVTELALVLAAEPALQAPALDLLAREQRTRSRTAPYPFLYARAWHTLQVALHAGDPHAALHAAGRFLGVVEGPRPLLWYAALRDVHAFCRALGGAAGRAAVVLAAEVPPHAGLPASLRLAGTGEAVGIR